LVHAANLVVRRNSENKAKLGTARKTKERQLKRSEMYRREEKENKEANCSGHPFLSSRRL